MGWTKLLGVEPPNEAVREDDNEVELTYDAHLYEIAAKEGRGRWRWA